MYAGETISVRDHTVIVTVNYPELSSQLSSTSSTTFSSFSRNVSVELSTASPWSWFNDVMDWAPADESPRKKVHHRHLLGQAPVVMRDRAVKRPFVMPPYMLSPASRRSART